MSSDLELIVFESDPRRAAELQSSGFSSFIVDLEYIGKDLRQLGFDTEINFCKPEDIAVLAALPDLRVWTRLNAFGSHTRDEVENAIAKGAGVIMLPMVSSPREADLFTRYVNARAETCVMIETPQGVVIAAELDRTPIDAVYFGLNDFAIATNQFNIFLPIRNGVIQRTREALRSKRFGFGGLTHVELGHPVPCIKILEELERLNCQMTFLRRSFRRDLQRFTSNEIIGSITASWARARERSPLQRARDFDTLSCLVSDLRETSFTGR